MGRPRATTHDELEAVGMDLFRERGYENVSVQQIADAAGVSRRTFFRYFPTKSDLPWGNFGQEVERLRAWLTAVPPEVPLMAALRRAVVDFNRVPPEAIDQHRARLGLILTEPELIARSLLKFQLWREAVAEFAARRLDMPATAFLPELIGEIALSAAVAAYREWIPTPTADLPTLIDTAFAAILHLEGLEHGAAAGLAQHL
ncbi:MAG: mycofactocin system transcriptional regulator, partial [Citricoccus sp.]